MNRQERIEKSLARITSWMSANGAEDIAENLADGATPEKVDELVGNLGFALPEELRALWSLHDGQKDEGNNFFNSFEFYSTGAAWDQREDAEMFVQHFRENLNDQDVSESGATKEELLSSKWILFAGQGYADSLVMSGESGRVFWCGKDSPPLKLLANSLSDYLEDYAGKVASKSFVVEEGFGGIYLETRK